MGCWGFGILESDGAMDFEEEIQSMALVEPCTALRVGLEQQLPKILQRLANEPVLEGDTYFYAEGHQVLAVMLMREGCAFSEEVRQQLVTGSQSCFEYQGTLKLLAQSGDGVLTQEAVAQWATEQGLRCPRNYKERLLGRKKAIDHLCQALQHYNLAGGVPVALEQKGLLDAFAERFAL